MERDATPGWRTVFAIARTIVLHGGGTRAIADRIGIPLDEVRAAMPALGTHVFHTPESGGKQPTRPPCATGPGGVPGIRRNQDLLAPRHHHRRASGPADRARRGDVGPVGGAAVRRLSSNRTRLTAFFAQHPDMAVLGYEPATVNEATCVGGHPAGQHHDPHRAEGCCTDDFITAHVLYEDSWWPRTRMR